MNPADRRAILAHAPTEAEVTLYRLVDARGDVVSAPDMDSDIYTSRAAADADVVMLASRYGSLVVQSATVSISWGLPDDTVALAMSDCGGQETPQHFDARMQVGRARRAAVAPPADAFARLPHVDDEEF